MKNYIKILSDDNFNTKHKLWQKIIIKELEDHSTEITPKFYRNGWYYNRAEDISWKELNGRAWLDSKNDMFKYALEIQNHRPLLQKERNAITILIQNKLASKKLRRLFYIDRCLLECRQVYLSVKIHAKEVKRKIKK